VEKKNLGKGDQHSHFKEEIGGMKETYKLKNLVETNKSDLLVASFLDLERNGEIDWQEGAHRHIDSACSCAPPL
jgi:hypothetical protein